MEKKITEARFLEGAVQKGQKKEKKPEAVGSGVTGGSGEVGPSPSTRSPKGEPGGAES